MVASHIALALNLLLEELVNIPIELLTCSDILKEIPIRELRDPGKELQEVTKPSGRKWKRLKEKENAEHDYVTQAVPVQQ